jgi:hypothetical protein
MDTILVMRATGKPAIEEDAGLLADLRREIAREVLVELLEPLADLRDSLNVADVLRRLADQLEKHNGHT